MASVRFLACVALCVCGLAQAPAGRADDDSLRYARLDPGPERPSRIGELPQALSVEDAGRYRMIFELQRDGRWREADPLIARLRDRLLLGHVLAQRYLHRAYKTSYPELASWLESYADLPVAANIHRLAVARHTPGQKLPITPVEGFLGGYGQELGTRESTALARRLMSNGLEAWRRRDYARAAEAFALLAGNEDADGEDVATGAFWAARAHLLAGRPQLVPRFLRIAARASDEFYGLLAQTLLGQSIRFDWHERSLRGDELQVLLVDPASRRAMALAQIGQEALAESEIRKLAARSRPELVHALAALAEAMRLPAAQMRVAQRLRVIDGRRHDAALYPLPPWEPADGFKVDRSLVYAIIRAESAFDIDARSPANARGLMQVLPETATLVARGQRIAYKGDASLYEPELNLRMGQGWLLRLARTKTVGRSLIHLVTAYNGGETRLKGWLARELRGVKDDPLLFIETIPLTETRNYVKKVLANLWAYQTRLGEPMPTLRALAENRWPVFVMIDQRPVARHARAN